LSITSDFTKAKITVFSGRLSEVGFAYGSHYRRLIGGFLQAEAPALKNYLRLAEKTLSFTKRYTPHTAELISGIARGSGLSLLEVNRLFLHEEIYHLKSLPQTHCSAIAYPGSLTASGGGLIGQNWDWPLSYIPWGGLVRLKPKHFPRILCYHYPGLINCCGINSSGLSLMWTGGGYYPVIKPKIGVPTYALISEIMLKSNVKEALTLLSNTPRAGSFMFLLADKSGASCVVEATPTVLRVIEGAKALFRANLYSDPEIQKASRQPKPDAKKIHSVGRIKALEGMVNAQKGPVNAQSIQAMLVDKRVFVDLKGRSLTLAQFVADCKKGILYCRDGTQQSSSWNQFRV
jgi:isopenicillin-N N-acyltransferase like protein